MSDNTQGPGFEYSDFLSFDKEKHLERIAKMKVIKDNLKDYIHKDAGVAGIAISCLPGVGESEIILTKEQMKVSDEVDKSVEETLRMFEKIILFLEQVGNEHEELDKKMGELIKTASENMGLDK